MSDQDISTPQNTDTQSVFDATHNDHSDYIDGLLIRTNKGIFATLYARQYCNNARMLKSLTNTTNMWSAGIYHPFKYMVKPIPVSVTGREDFQSGPYCDMDCALAILGYDAESVMREADSAIRVLSILGLRNIGCVDTDDESIYDTATQRLVETVRQTLSVASVASVLTKENMRSIQNSDYMRETHLPISNPDSIPVGATHEWVMLRAIAAVTGVSTQPADIVRMYGDERNAHNSRNTWYVDRARILLDDARIVRTFLNEKLNDLRARYIDMCRHYSQDYTHLCSHISDAGLREYLDKQIFQYVSDTLAIIQEQVQYSLAEVVLPYGVSSSGISSNTESTDMWDSLWGVGEFCRFGGMGWAADICTMLCHIVEFLHVLERGALVFQQDVIRQMCTDEFAAVDSTLDALKGKTIRLAGGFDQRVTGHLLRNDQLPVVLGADFPCVVTDDGQLVMVPGARVEDHDNGLVTLVIPPVPEIPRFELNYGEYPNPYANGVMLDDTEFL